MKKDVSILIVHFNTPGLLKQTLKGIFNAHTRITFEVIVVDNNPTQRVSPWIKKEFPFVKIILTQENIGFGRGMNLAMEQANARYFFVFNPDIAVFDGTFDALTAYMDAHLDIGMLGPKLLNPDRSLQYSCYRFMTSAIIFYRRVPFLRSLPFAKRAVAQYQMKEWNHEDIRDVDYLLGAAMLVRAEAVASVGGFDPAFFVYFEDQDWCRRFWLANWRVVYHADVRLVHYHRRETAEGSFFAQMKNPLTRIQLQSALYYYRKYKGHPHPRHDTHTKISS